MISEQDKPEPFDLERALAGEPINHGGRKCFICKNPLPDSNKDYIVSGQYSLFLTDLSFLQICKMWKEPQPEPNTVTLTLPCPVLNPEIGKTYYTPIITDVDGYDPDGHFSDIAEWVVDNEDGHIDWQSQHRLEEGLVFETKNDVKAWLNAMKNNRR